VERIQKVIANAGYCSRRKAEDLIKEGRVLVNGEVITELGTKVNHTDIISIDGVIINKEVPLEYYLLNKPRQVLSSAEDKLGRIVVTDLINTEARIYPIGRLDYDTTGLILLTNDGELTNILTHPSFEVEKTYVVKIDKLLDKDEIRELKQGIKIDNRKVEVKRFKIKKKDIEKETEIVEITIIEGRNHIIKKLFAYLGADVKKLSRVGYGFLSLDNLKSGEYRKLTIKEIKKLYSYKKD